jgi:hypothetical protein
MFSNGPYLDGNETSNVTTQISTHAYLPCKVSLVFSFLALKMMWYELYVNIKIP